MQHVFANRRVAGAALADALGESAAERPDPVVLALPRGGVPVALEIALALDAPLDLVLVRKIGVPGQPELAAAAVVDGDAPQMVVNDEIVRATGMSTSELAAAREEQLREIARRRAAWLDDRSPVPVTGRDVIVVDDGIATGATMRTALRALRRQGPRSLTLAVPVAASDALAAIRGEVDRTLALATPEPFHGVGAHFRDFHQLDDDEVRDLLQEADRRRHDDTTDP